MPSRTDFEVVSSLGVTIRTFDDLKAARKWMAERKEELPGLSLYEVERFEVRRKIGGFAKLKVAA